MRLLRCFRVAYVWAGQCCPDAILFVILGPLLPAAAKGEEKTAQGSDGKRTSCNLCAGAAVTLFLFSLVSWTPSAWIQSNGQMPCKPILAQSGFGCGNVWSLLYTFAVISFTHTVAEHADSFASCQSGTKLG